MQTGDQKSFSLKSLSVSLLTGIIMAGVFSFAMYAFATPPGSKYTPGETLDPSCAPGDTNCSVLAAATASDNLSFFAATTSAELLGVISNETGSGALVFATSPTLVTPTLGAATATSINGLTITSSTGTLTITNGKTFTSSNTLTFAGTDGSTLNIGTGGTLGTNAYTSTAYAPLASPTFTGTVTIPSPFTLGATSVTSTGTQLNYLAAATGTTGTTNTNLVFSTSPTLVTPVLGAATATSINGLTITSSTGTLTIADSKTLTASNTITLTATDGSTLAIGSGGTLGTAAYTAASAYAVTALSNLASVAINTSLISDTDNTDDLGSATFEWKDIYIDGTAYLDAIDLNGTAISSTAAQLNYLSAATGTTGTTSTNIVFSTSPTLVTPVLGAATATSINKVAFTAPATSATLTIADGKTLTASNTITFTATDGSTLAIGTGGTLGTAAYTAASAYAVTALSNLASVAINTSLISDTDNTDDLGSATFEWKDIYIDGTAYLDAIDLNGTAVSSTAAQLNYLASATGTTGTTSTNIVFSTSPTLVTPTLGAATATTINKVTITAPATGSTLTIAEGKTLTASNTIAFTATDGSTLAIGTGGTLGTNAYTSTAYAPLASPTFTGTVTIPTPFTLGATSVTSTGTQLNYLASATGTTGTTSTNLVFSTSPTLVTPALGNATSGTIVASGLITANAGVTIGNGATTAGVLTLLEDTDAGSNFASFQVPALAANTVYVLPADDGDSGEQLQTDGSGNLTWEAASSGGANTALSNLASVAINTSLISDTDNTDDLGSATFEWKDLYIDGTAYVDAIDLNGTALTTTATRLNYLTSAGGTTGTTSTNIVFSTSPTLVTPVLGVATATTINGVTIPSTTDTAALLGRSQTFTNKNTFTVARTIASAADAVLDDIGLTGGDITITGTTQITTATGFNKVSIYRPRYVDDSAVTIDYGATLYIEEAPHTTGSSATLTNAYALWVDGGAVRIDGSLTVGALTNPVFAASGGVLATTLLNGIAEGRLTLTSGTAVTTADVTAAGTLYYTPYKGNRIALNSSGIWKLYTFEELSLALTLTSANNYDIFVYDNSGTLTLESLIWTNNTTRATAISLTDGVYVKEGDTTRRYVGTIRASGTDTTEDSAKKRFVWNMNNRVMRTMAGPTETTDSWTYSTASWRQANNSTTNQLAFVIGVNEDAVQANASGLTSTSAGAQTFKTAIGLDVTNANSGQVIGYAGATATPTATDASYVGYPGIGYHFLAWLEYGAGADTQTWFGDGGAPTNVQQGIVGNIMN